MPRTVADLPAGSRITDYISLGVLAKTFPSGKVQEILKGSGKASIRERDMPAHVVIYYVIALSLYMQSSCREVLRCLLEGVQWLAGPLSTIKVTGRAEISQARKRIGSEPLKRLHDAIVGPLATTRTQGAWYREWRLVSLDGSTLDVADTVANVAAFGKGVRFARSRRISPDPLCLFDRERNSCPVRFPDGWLHHIGTCAGKTSNPGIICRYVVSGGSFVPRLFLVESESLNRRRPALASGQNISPAGGKKTARRVLPQQPLSFVQDRQRQRNAITVRVIEYRLEGVADAEPRYRLITTILDHVKAPAEELAALYHERWEIETALDELKTHLRGSRIILRSKMPDLVRQEFHGLMMAHFAVRSLMHDAALRAHVDPDRLSFLHAVRVARRKLPLYGAIPPSGSESVSGSHSR
jgi:hypothetical protein